MVELSDADRANTPSKYAAAKADFDGNGMEDEALLLKSINFSGEGLWVRLSRADRTTSWIKLDEIDWGSQHPSATLNMGITVEPPGSYRYACFDEDNDCDFGSERPRMTLNYPGIAYFRFESASSLFFWSDKENRFRRAWTSD